MILSEGTGLAGASPTHLYLSTTAVLSPSVTMTRILRSAVTIFRATRIPLVAVRVGAAGASLSALAQQCQWDTLILTINASYREERVENLFLTLGAVQIIRVV